MILDLNEFFLKFGDVTYCVIKPDKRLPSYVRGSDLDLFCYNPGGLAQIILAIGNKYVGKDIEIIVSNMNAQIHIDFIHKESKEIEFRFDIYGKLPDYQNVLIKPAFFENIMENRIKVDLESGCSIFVPSLIDDNILRYIEYHEWYGQRPDKIKHIDHIMEFCSPDDQKRFLEKLHHYTELPLVESVYPVKLKQPFFVTRFAKKIFSRLPERLKLFIKKFM